MLDDGKARQLRDGLVIPAHPLALTADRTLDADRQGQLTRHYLDSGAGGLAVGVHTTQFAIRDPAYGLYEPVLRLAAETARDWARSTGEPEPLLVAGVLGPTANAVAEASVAADLGYDLALVATPGWGDSPEQDILDGVAAVGEVLPVFGFYLQPALSGRRFGYAFWRRYAQIPAVRAVKVAPFDRYATLEVIRAVIDARRADDGTERELDPIALYTGNDDNIVVDLLTPYEFGGTTVHIVGGLLGQWAVWTPAAVQLHRRIRALVRSGGRVPLDLLAYGARLTDANAAVFDSPGRFAGSIAGVNEVLRRDGLLAGAWCLSGEDRLSTGQAEELDRVYAEYG